MYIPRERESVDEPVQFSVHVVHVLGDSGKHDTYTAAVNIRKVLELLQEKDRTMVQCGVSFCIAMVVPKSIKTQIPWDS